MWSADKGRAMSAPSEAGTREKRSIRAGHREASLRGAGCASNATNPDVRPEQISYSWTARRGGARHEYRRFALARTSAKKTRVDRRRRFPRSTAEENRRSPCPRSSNRCYSVSRRDAPTARWSRALRRACAASGGCARPRPRPSASSAGPVRIGFENPIRSAAGYDKRAGGAGIAAGIGTRARTVTSGPARQSTQRIHRLHPSARWSTRWASPTRVDALLEQDFEPRGRCRIGINIGKGKDTPLERAAEDYCALLVRVAPRADYVAVNISSPNTPGLPKRQDRASLARLLGAVASTRDGQPRRAPCLVRSRRPSRCESTT